MHSSNLSESLAFGLWQEEDAEDSAPELADGEQDVDPVLHGAQHGEEALAYDRAVDHGHEDGDTLPQTPRFQRLYLGRNHPPCTHLLP